MRMTLITGGCGFIGSSMPARASAAMASGG